MTNQHDSVSQDVILQPEKWRRRRRRQAVRACALALEFVKPSCSISSEVCIFCSRAARPPCEPFAPDSMSSRSDMASRALPTSVRTPVRSLRKVSTSLLMRSSICSTIYTMQRNSTSSSAVQVPDALQMPSHVRKCQIRFDSLNTQRLHHLRWVHADAHFMAMHTSVNVTILESSPAATTMLRGVRACPALGLLLRPV